MSKQLIDCLTDADLLEVDGHSIRYFGLDEGEMETGGNDAVVLSLTAEDEWVTYEWQFTREALECAEYDPAQEAWTVNEGGQESLIRLYRLTPLTPETLSAAEAV